MSDQPKTPLEAAILRGRNLKNENPLIRPYTPPQDMYLIILAAILNLHDKVEELCNKLNDAPAISTNISYNNQTLSENADLEVKVAEMMGLTSFTSQLVSKPCAKCGKMMNNVPPARKYCDECKGVKK